MLLIFRVTEHRSSAPLVLINNWQGFRFPFFIFVVWFGLISGGGNFLFSFRVHWIRYSERKGGRKRGVFARCNLGSG